MCQHQSECWFQYQSQCLTQYQSQFYSVSNPVAVPVSVPESHPVSLSVKPSCSPSVQIQFQSVSNSVSSPCVRSSFSQCQTQFQSQCWFQFQSVSNPVSVKCVRSSFSQCQAQFQSHYQIQFQSVSVPMSDPVSVSAKPSFSHSVGSSFSPSSSCTHWWINWGSVLVLVPVSVPMLVSVSVLVSEWTNIKQVRLYSPTSRVRRTMSMTPDSGVTGLCSGWTRSTLTVVPFWVYRSDLESARMRQLPRRPARENFGTSSSPSSVVSKDTCDSFKLLIRPPWMVRDGPTVAKHDHSIVLYYRISLWQWRLVKMEGPLCNVNCFTWIVGFHFFSFVISRINLAESRKVQLTTGATCVGRLEKRFFVTLRYVSVFVRYVS